MEVVVSTTAGIVCSQIISAGAELNSFDFDIKCGVKTGDSAPGRLKCGRFLLVLVSHSSCDYRGAPVYRTTLERSITGGVMYYYY